MKKDIFETLFNDLINSGFWCYQGDDALKVYKYINELESVRFARKKEMFPNMGFIPFDKTKKAKNYEFDNPQKIRIKNFEFKIHPIEFEILYKEKILCGKKDFEDAKHLRVFFSDMIKSENFKKYNPIIEEELK